MNRGDAMKLETWISLLLTGRQMCRSVRNIHHPGEKLYPLSYLLRKIPLFPCTWETVRQTDG